MLTRVFFQTGFFPGVFFSACLSLLVLHAQNVGIGVPNPQRKLHIGGDLRIDRLVPSAPPYTTGDSLMLRLSTGDVSGIALTGDSAHVLRGDGTFGASPAHDHDWYKATTTVQPTSINENIYTQGKVGIGTTNPQYRLHLAGDGMIYATGTTGSGDTIPSGAQTAFIWNPRKAALRAGQVTGNQWNHNAVGLYSIAFGYDNTASGMLSIIGGGAFNIANALATTISGGAAHLAADTFATIGGGYADTASGVLSTVCGGGYNKASGYASTIGGGGANLASGATTVIGGGLLNRATDTFATIGGGYLNTAQGIVSTISGGAGNLASGYGSTIGGGGMNLASGAVATIGGGYLNAATDTFSTVAGGYRDSALATGSTIGGGAFNVARGVASTIAGGAFNTTTQWASTVSGGYGNAARGLGSTISGGMFNLTRDTFSVVGGGYRDTARGYASTVSGGTYNVAEGDGSTIAGGAHNLAQGTGASIGGGAHNVAADSFAVIGGGFGNTAAAYASLVSGGYQNLAQGRFSTVGGGSHNVAGGNYSWAGGRGIHLDTSAHYTFAWGDYNVSVGTPPVLTASHAFLIGPVGTTYRVGINVSNPTYALELPNNTNNSIGKGRANAWTTYSDARIKSHITPINTARALEQILQLRPVHYFHHSSRWTPGGQLQVLPEGEYRYGFLAQQLKRVVPEAVDVPHDTTRELYGVNYDVLIPLLVAAIQEQQRIIQALWQTVQIQQRQIHHLQYVHTERNASIGQGRTVFKPAQKESNPAQPSPAAK